MRTLDKVIRREFRLVEGDAFNTSKLQRSEQRIKNLGFFKKIDITTNARQRARQDGHRRQCRGAVDGRVLGRRRLLDHARARSATSAIRERNLLGRGQDLRIGTVIAQRQQQVDLSFTEPYFLDRNLAAGFDLFEINQDNQLIGQYDQFTVGGTLRMGYQITESLRQTLTYTLRQDTHQQRATDRLALHSGSRPARATPRPSARCCSTTSATTASTRAPAISVNSASISPASAATFVTSARC